MRAGNSSAGSSTFVRCAEVAASIAVITRLMRNCALERVIHFVGWAKALSRRAHHCRPGFEWWARCALPTLRHDGVRLALRHRFLGLFRALALVRVEVLLAQP